MAKELPYFKFEPSQWENGNIQLCSLEAQGVFINICSMYWQRLGNLPYKLALVKICRGNEKTIKSLIENGVVKVDENLIKIDFLDQQLDEFKIISSKRAESGRKGGENRVLSPELARIKGNQIYIIHCYDDCEEFIKVGITSESISRRFSGKIPYRYDILFQFSTDDNLDFEIYCKAELSDHAYIPRKEFIGYLECFGVSSIDYLNKIIKHRTGNAIALPKLRNAIRGEERREEKRKEDKKQIAIALPFEGDVLNSWNSWVQHRIELKKKLTPSTIKKQIQFLGGRAGPEIIAIIDQSITNGWTGLFELKNNNNGHRIGTKNQVQPTTTVIEPGKSFGIEKGFSRSGSN